MKMLNFPSPYRPGESPYEIFSNRMLAINQIVRGIKGRILNKYNKGLIDTTIDQLNLALSADQSTEMINLLKADPVDIYPDEEKLNIMAGQFVDITNVMGKVTQQSKMMGGRSSMMGIPPTGTPTSEVMLPKGDSMQFLNAVMNMPSGQMDFAPILNYMKEHRPGMMGSFSPVEEWALNKAMGQISDPKKELGEALDLTKKWDELFGEKTEPRVTSEIDMFMRYPEKWKELQDIKASYKEESRTAWEIKVDTLIDWRDKGMISEAELKKGIGIDITPKKKSDWEKKFDILMQLNPSADEVKKFVGAYVTEPGTTDKITTTEINLVEKQFANVKTNTQYEQALATVRQTDKNVKVPTKEELFMGNYNKAISHAKSLIDKDGKILEGELKGYSYEILYQQAYINLQQAIKEYQIATGQLLDNPFISLEEYEKSDIKPGKGLFYPSTWGQQKSVFKNIQTTEQIFGGTK